MKEYDEIAHGLPMPPRPLSFAEALAWVKRDPILREESVQLIDNIAYSVMERSRGIGE